MFTKFITALLLATSLASLAHANDVAEMPETNMMDELDPFDPNIEQKLEEMDARYQEETGESPFFMDGVEEATLFAAACRGISCPVYISVNKSTQSAALYQNGRVIANWLVSTGVAGRGTPNFEGNPNGRIYDKYTSTKYPEGDYKGLGNMPYAVFYNGGFAIHGTTVGNIKRLGTRASHGCVRVHPDNGFTFNRLVRQYGIKNVWISIHD